MPSKKNESNYILCKFSKFIEEIHLKKGSFRAILVPKTKEDTKVDAYYIYPTLDVLKCTERVIVIKQLRYFMKEGKNPKDSIGFSGVICQEKNTWEDQIVSNYKFITPINIDQIPRLGYTVSKKEKHEASSNNMPIEINKQINKYYIWNTLADLSLGKVHYIYIKKAEEKGLGWTIYIIPTCEEAGKSKKEIEDCLNDLVSDKKLSSENKKKFDVCYINICEKNDTGSKLLDIFNEKLSKSNKKLFIKCNQIEKSFKLNNYDEEGNHINILKRAGKKVGRAVEKIRGKKPQ